MDGELVRTQEYLPPGQYPQTPSFLKFGIWAGGDPTLPKGTREWAGGNTDYSKGYVFLDSFSPSISILPPIVLLFYVSMPR